MLIGYFLGPVALGYYSIAYRLLLIMIKLLTTVTTQVALPAFSRMQKDLKRMRKTFYKVTQYTSLISFPAFIGMAVLAPELVQTLFGEEWMPSVSVMRILAFSGILQSVYQFNGTILLSMGKPSWSLGLQCLGMIRNITVFLLLVKWGIVAVAAGFVIGGYLFSPLPLFLIKKIIHIDLVKYASQFLAPITSSVIMAGALFIMKPTVSDWISNNTLILLISTTLGGFIYVFTLALVSPKLVKELRGYLSPRLSF